MIVQSTAVPAFPWFLYSLFNPLLFLNYLINSLKLSLFLSLSLSVPSLRG